MTTLSPCPFCGGINLHVGLGILEQVYCEACDAYGPARMPSHAQLAWNTRRGRGEQMSKLTPWFVATEHNPARVGWYAVTCRYGLFGCAGKPTRLYWTGETWKGDAPNKFGARYCSCDSWRGLKSKSGAGEKG